jgi:dihydrofolate reductase
MGTIVVTTNLSLDGVVEDPDGQEGFRHGGWFRQFAAGDFDAWADVLTDEALKAEAMLLGRKTDEWFAARWADRRGVWADRLNALPKYVVSSTVDQPRWSNATVLRGDVVKEVAELKEEIDGDIIVYASYQLVRALVEHGLVDEFRLVIFPVVLGAGQRLFGETSDKTALRLVRARTIGESLSLLAYEVLPAT